MSKRFEIGKTKDGEPYLTVYARDPNSIGLYRFFAQRVTSEIDHEPEERTALTAQFDELVAGARAWKNEQPGAKKTLDLKDRGFTKVEE